MAPAEAAVLRTFLENPNKVLGRGTLLRLSGLQHCTPRRCDGIVSSLRRMLGEDTVVTVRGRGWMMPGEHVATARDVLSHLAA